MSKGYGKVQRKILEILFKHKDLYESFDRFGRKNLHSYPAEDIIEWFYNDEVKNLSLIQKQRIYKAIQRLGERGLVDKKITTEERNDLPPMNYLLVIADIEGNKIYNLNKHEFEDFKRLIGTKTI